MKKRYVIMSIVLIVALAIGVYFFTNNNEPTTKEEAIKQAQNYNPRGNCLDVETYALHRETRATYMFPTSCIPNGWMVPTPLNQP